MGNMFSSQQSFNSRHTMGYAAQKLGSTALGNIGATIIDSGKAIVNGVQTVVNAVVFVVATFAEGLRNVNGHYMIGN